MSIASRSNSESEEKIVLHEVWYWRQNVIDELAIGVGLQLSVEGVEEVICIFNVNDCKIKRIHCSIIIQFVIRREEEKNRIPRSLRGLYRVAKRTEHLIHHTLKFINILMHFQHY